MNIPNRVSPVSFDSSLPKGYTRLAWLQGTGTQWINTEVTGNETSEVLCTFERISARSSGIYCAAKKGVTNNVIAAFGWDDVMESLRFDWFTAQRTAKNVYSGGMVTTVHTASGVTLNGVQLPLTFPEGAFISPTFVLFNLRAELTAWTADNIRMAHWALKNGGQPVRDMVPVLDPTGEPCMYDLVTRAPFKRGGSGQFIAGLTLSQARGLSLPAGGGEMTLSLPYEASVDRMVQEALEAARLNGWTLTVQYQEGELPAGWHRAVSFLESTGTQYIDTGVKLSSESEVRCELQSQDSEVSPKQSPYGYSGDTSKQFYCFSQYADASVIIPKTIFYLPQNFISSKVHIVGRCRIVHNKQGFLVNDTFTPVSTEIREDFETPRGCYLCASVNNSTKFIGQIYSFTLSRAGTPQRNLQPCIDAEGKPCMWDSVQQKALPNAGEGQFVVGLETVEDVRAFLLPPSGGELTLSLPQAASTDFDSQLALNRARSHGWTLSIQYREEQDVPEGYKRLEFLESTGTQYINTGYIPNNETGLLLDQEKLIVGDTMPMGCRNSTSEETRFYVPRSDASGYDGAGGGPGFGWGLWNRFDFYASGRQVGKLNWQNNRVAELNATTYSLDSLSFEPTQSIYMFAANITGQASLNWGGRIYVAQISQGAETVHNYIPCISPEGKVGMYNKVDGTLKENAGSGAFIAGLATAEDVRTLYLPEISGELTVSVPADTTDEDIDLMQFNNSTWLIAVQRRENEN